MTKIENFFIPGPAGRIECMLKRPAPGAEAGAAAAICHPHPLFGGTMHNKVVHAAAEALVAAGLPTLRFNFRGAGGSGGIHDGGRGEQDDLKAVLDHVAGRFPGRPLVLAGYSFGAYVSLRSGCGDGRAAALIGIGLPITMMTFDFLAGCDRPLTLIQGDQDLFGPLPLVMAVAATLPQGARVVAIPGAAHNFAGRLDELALRVGEAVPAELVAARAE
jgi:hypothetical protein